MKRATVIGCVALLFAGIAWTQEATSPAKKAQEPDQGVFGPTKVWQFHLELTTKDWDKMQPTGGMRFPGGSKKPDDKRGDKPADIHKGSGFGLEFPWVHADLSAEGKTYKSVGLRYKGNASYGTTSRGLKRNFRIDLDHYDDKLNSVRLDYCYWIFVSVR